MLDGDGSLLGVEALVSGYGRSRAIKQWFGQARVALKVVQRSRLLLFNVSYR